MKVINTKFFNLYKHVYKQIKVGKNYKFKYLRFPDECFLAVISPQINFVTYIPIHFINDYQYFNILCTIDENSVINKESIF